MLTRMGVGRGERQAAPTESTGGNIMCMRSRAATAILAVVMAVTASCARLGDDAGLGEETPARPAANSIAAVAEHLKAPLETRVLLLAYVSPESTIWLDPKKENFAVSPTGKPLIELLRALKSDRGKVVALKGTNSLFIQDTPEKLAAMEKLIDEADKPAKQVHLSVKLLMLSDVATIKASILFLPGWRPAEAPALEVLKTPTFAELQGFLKFIRFTRGSIVQAPQRMVLDHEAAMIDFEAEHRRTLALFSGPKAAGRGRPLPPPDLTLYQTSRFVVTPHVIGPDNDVILSFATAAAKPGEEVADDSPDTQTNDPSPAIKVRVRDRETAIIACGRGELGGEKVNVLVMITPTVVDFEKRSDIEKLERRARQALGAGFEIEETPLETRVFLLTYVWRGGNVSAESPVTTQGSTRDAAKEGSLLDLLEAMKSDRGKITPMMCFNALTITDTPETLAAMKALIKKVDQPPKQGQPSSLPTHVTFYGQVVTLSDADLELLQSRLAERGVTPTEAGEPHGAESRLSLRSLSKSDQVWLWQFIRAKKDSLPIPWFACGAPQLWAVDGDEVLFSLCEAFRQRWKYAVYIGPPRPKRMKPEDAPFDPDVWLSLSPRVSRPDDDVILSVAWMGESQHDPVMPAVEIRLPSGRAVLVSGLRTRVRGEETNVVILLRPRVHDLQKRARDLEAARQAKEEVARPN